MSDSLTELNRIMDHLASCSDVAATALAGGGLEEYLVLSDEIGQYTLGDAWTAGFDMTASDPEQRGSLMARKCQIAGAEVTFLFGQPGWASTEPLNPDTEKVARSGLFEIHDPRGLIRALQKQCGVEVPQFAANDEISGFGDISAVFFNLVGLGQAVFISNTSTLLDWCDASGLSLEHANARIHEIYGVDVSGLNGGRLIDVFERIRQGQCYRTWRDGKDG